MHVLDFFVSHGELIKECIFYWGCFSLPIFAIFLTLKVSGYFRFFR